LPFDISVGLMIKKGVLKTDPCNKVPRPPKISSKIVGQTAYKFCPLRKAQKRRQP
jgi:hypothetical protein